MTMSIRWHAIPLLPAKLQNRQVWPDRTEKGKGRVRKKKKRNLNSTTLL